MKTIKEHLETLPEPYRTQALANFDPSFVRKPTIVGPTGALNCAFNWDKTSQGGKYWLQVCRHLKNPEEPLPYAGQIEPPTNALSALHAIALKKGFPVEDIMSVKACGAVGDWWYSLEDGVEHLINLKTE